MSRGGQSRIDRCSARAAHAVGLPGSLARRHNGKQLVHRYLPSQAHLPRAVPDTASSRLTPDMEPYGNQPTTAAEPVVEGRPVEVSEARTLQMAVSMISIAVLMSSGQAGDVERV